MLKYLLFTACASIPYCIIVPDGCHKFFALGFSWIIEDLATPLTQDYSQEINKHLLHTR